MFPQTFCRSIRNLNRKQVQTLINVSNVMKRLTEVKLYLAEENLTAQKVEEAEVLS